MALGHASVRADHGSKQRARQYIRWRVGDGRLLRGAGSSTSAENKWRVAGAAACYRLLVHTADLYAMSLPMALGGQGYRTGHSVQPSQSVA